MLAEAGEVDVNLTSFCLQEEEDSVYKKKNQSAADPVQHLELVVEPVFFKAVPFQTSIRCPVSEVVACIPCCLMLYLFKQL